jgi:hypothetical protein
MWLNERNESIKARHMAAYRQESGYIPLGVFKRDLFSINFWWYYEDYRAMFDNEMKKAEAMHRIGSDVIPTVVLRFDHGILPSMFGAKIERIGDYPWVKPWLRPDDIKKLELPLIDSGIIPLVSEAIEYFKSHTPADYVVCTPPELAPLDVAVAMFGSDIFPVFYDDPGLIRHLLELLTRNFIGVAKHFKALLGEPPKEKVSYLGTYMPGIRVAADSVVNLSPSMLADLINPTWKLMAQELGEVLVHYCPSPQEKYYHVIEPTLMCPAVVGIDQSGGIEYLDSAENPTRMITDTTMVAEAAFTRNGSAETLPDDSPNINRMTSIRWDDIGEWLESDYMKLTRTRRRGLILRTRVDSIQEGKDLYGLWQEHLAREHLAE